MKKASSAAVSLSSQEKEVNHHTNLLMDEEPLQVLPTMAAAIGLDESIVVQQLWYWLNPRRKSGKIIDGRRWIFNTYAEWRESNFPFWSEIHIKRLFLSLEKCGIIISCQPEGRISRRKYYRLSDWFVNRAKRGEIGGSERIIQIRSSDQVDTINGSSRYVPITETTIRDNVQRIHLTEAHASEALVFDAPIPKPVPKYEQLLAISAPQGMPSETEFERFLENSEEGECVLKYRSDLYSQFCDHKWHEWDKKANKWTPIRDWKNYTLKLGAKIRNDMP